MENLMAISKCIRIIAMHPMLELCVHACIKA